MVAKDPQITGARRRVARRFGDGHRRHRATGASFLPVPLRHEGQQLVEFAIGKPDQRQVEILGQQFVQFRRQQRLVPGAEFGQLVVGDPIRPALPLGQVPEHDHRRFRQPQLCCREHPAMPRDQLTVLADEAGHGPAELRHAGGDLRHLVRAMRLGIAGIGLELGQRPHLDPIRGKTQRHRRVIPRIRMDAPGFWTPGYRLDSTRGPAATRRVQLQGFDFAVFQAGSGGVGFRVASQKSGPVAGDVPRFARQHTNIARKEPRYQRLGSLDPDWSPRWTTEASGAASACALLSRVYSICSAPDAICLGVWCLA